MATVAGLPGSADSAPRIDRLVACKSVALQVHPLFGLSLTPVDCSDQFTTAERSVELLVEIYLDTMADVEVTLSDPDQNKVWEWKRRIGPPPGRYGSWTIWGTLPITANPDEIQRQNPLGAGTIRAQLTSYQVIRVAGKPVRERVGDWSLRVTVAGDPASTLKFILAPGP